MDMQRPFKSVVKGDQYIRVKMYNIDTDPPTKFMNDVQDQAIHIDLTNSKGNKLSNYSCNHSRQPYVIAGQIHHSSPTPSSDLSTLTNSFQSLDPKQFSISSDRPEIKHNNQLFSNNQNATNLLRIRNPSLYPINYRHSSSSIDHKSLNLQHSEQERQHQTNATTPFYTTQLRLSKHLSHQEQLWRHKHSIVRTVPSTTEALTSDLYLRRQISEEPQCCCSSQVLLARDRRAKRCSVHLNIVPSSRPQSSRFVQLQRKRLTPIPAPPKIPSNSATNTNTAEQYRLTMGQAQVDSAKPSRDTRNSLQQSCSLQLGQQMVSDSLDNIQMIVDEESNAFPDADQQQQQQQQSQQEQKPGSRYVFIPTEPDVGLFNADTMKPAIRRQQTNEQVTKAATTYVQQVNHSGLQLSRVSGQTESGNESNNANGAAFLAGAEHLVHFDDLDDLQQSEQRFEDNDTRRRESHTETQAKIVRDLTAAPRNRFVFDASKYLSPVAAGCRSQSVFMQTCLKAN